MTCSKQCRDCIYGIPRVTLICTNPNSTCDGNCYKCRWAVERIIKYVCTSEIAYGRGT